MSASTGRNWTITTIPEAIGKGADYATHGTIVFFRNVQSIYSIAPNDPSEERMLAVINDALGINPVEVFLNSSLGHITDVRPVVV